MSDELNIKSAQLYLNIEFENGDRKLITLNQAPEEIIFHERNDYNPIDKTDLELFFDPVSYQYQSYFLEFVFSPNQMRRAEQPLFTLYNVIPEE